MFSEYAVRAIRPFLRLARFCVCPIVAVWLAFAQPGMSYYWLIDPAVHAQVDAELYGQRPDGETLPGHEPRPPHEHLVLGVAIPGFMLTNPFDAAFYRVLLSPAQRLALLGQRIQLAVIAHSIAPEPLEQPPRPA
jgi:hypothetical protein